MKAKTIAVGGSVASLSADGGVVAAKVAVRSGTKVCDSAVAWRVGGARLTTFGKGECKKQASTDEKIGNLTVAGGRVVWADYQFGNHGYCSAMLTATLSRPKPRNLGLCDGHQGDVYYDFAGQGSLLVAREYTLCEADCAPDYNDTYQDAITLYQVTGAVAKIGPLKRDTHLRDIDAGRLLLSRGASLEVVTPKQGRNALHITAKKSVGRAFLSGNDVLAVSGTSLTGYDATSGAQTQMRTLPAGATVADFSKGVVLYTKKQAIHVLRLTDGRDRTVATIPGLVAARLDATGLYYGYNTHGKGSAGRLAFIPFSAVTRLLAGS